MQVVARYRIANAILVPESVCPLFISAHFAIFLRKINLNSAFSLAPSFADSWTPGRSFFASQRQSIFQVQTSSTKIRFLDRQLSSCTADRSQTISLDAI